jgi:hypothetical protein
MEKRGWALPLAFFVTFATAALGAPGAHATTYIVGTCKVGTQFSKIQDALNATPAPTIVEVCPGKYAEQVTISKPVTLEGVASGNSSLATLVPPSGGLKSSGTLPNGNPVAAQIFIENVAGAVNLTNLLVDSSNNENNSDLVVGIIYINTPGTVNHVVAYNVSATVGGDGIYLAGGSSNPKVTVENSTFDHDDTGIEADGVDVGDLTVTIQNNLFNLGITGIQVRPSNVTVTVSANVLTGMSNAGMIFGDVHGSATSNTIVSGLIGIDLAVDGMSIKTNKIYNATNGMLVAKQVTNSQITGNVLTTIAGEGISTNCNFTVPPSKVHSNTFVDTPTGYIAAPFSVTGNTFIGVASERSDCP